MTDLVTRLLAFHRNNETITFLDRDHVNPDGPEAVDEITRLTSLLDEAREALRLHQAWFDSEKSGPDYGAQTRDTHPDGERIWRQWWNDNLDLCALARKMQPAPPSPNWSSPMTIEEQKLLDEIAELKRQRMMILAAIYPEAPKFVAKICDESLDRSGRLFSEVRALVHKAILTPTSMEEPQ